MYRTINILWAVILAVPVGLHEASAAYRQPVQVIELESSLLVGNRRSGTVSVIDLDTMRVANELGAGQAVSDIAIIRHAGSGSPPLIAVSDSGSCQLLLYAWNNGRLIRQDQVRVPATPERLLALPNGKLALSSTWARQLTLWRPRRNPSDRWEFQSDGVLDLPFAPRELCHIAASGQTAEVTSSGSTAGQLVVASPVPLTIDWRWWT